MRRHLIKLQRTSVLAIAAIVVAVVVALSTTTYATCGCKDVAGNCQDIQNPGACRTGGTTVCINGAKLTCEAPPGSPCASWAYHGTCTQ